MIQGLAFMSHQLGSFLGAYGRGVLYDALGSYTLAWRIGPHFDPERKACSCEPTMTTPCRPERLTIS
jgi:hypothetical protein